MPACGRARTRNTFKQITIDVRVYSLCLRRSRLAVIFACAPIMNALWFNMKLYNCKIDRVVVKVRYVRMWVCASLFYAYDGSRKYILKIVNCGSQLYIRAQRSCVSMSIFVRFPRIKWDRLIGENRQMFKFKFDFAESMCSCAICANVARK